MKNAVLKGILTPVLSSQVNLINAGALAQQRGVEVAELRSARRATFSNSLGMELCTEGESTTGFGMVGMRGALRILGLNDIDIEAPLRGIIIFIRNEDVPGVIGRVGTILGDRKINIATFTLGRNPQTQQAIALGQCRQSRARRGAPGNPHHSRRPHRSGSGRVGVEAPGGAISPSHLPPSIIRLFGEQQGGHLKKGTFTYLFGNFFWPISAV